MDYMHVSSEISNDTGRSRLEVEKEDILMLKRLNYSWTRIAEILDISRTTLYRRLQEFNIDTDKFTNIPEQELDQVIKQVRTEHPNTGEVILQGLLAYKNIKVPREKLRTAIHRVDHTNTVSRQSSVVNHRVYSAPHPNHVWHIDGNHKMIRWRLVIHAGVDGFSRCIVYIKCANNNCATTVMDAFQEGINVYGQPNHVRSDHGGENMEVWRYMVAMWDDPSCVITGSSTHNERVERMWRDVTRCVSSSYINLFTAFENEGALDPINEIDMFCLHYVFIPRLNKSLTDFQGSWNHHPLSTEGNLSPLQLYSEGLAAVGAILHADTSTAASSTSSIPDSAEAVKVPSNKFLPCHQLLLELQSAINPTSECADFGRELYYDCIQRVGLHLQTVCNNCEIV